MTNIDWVTKRANCTLDDIFHHVIYGQIQNDVTIANALPRKKRDSSQYSIKYDKKPSKYPRLSAKVFSGDRMCTSGTG